MGPEARTPTWWVLMDCRPDTIQSTSGRGDPEPLQVMTALSPSRTVKLTWLTLISGRSGGMTGQEKYSQTHHHNLVPGAMVALLALPSTHVLGTLQSQKCHTTSPADIRTPNLRLRHGTERGGAWQLLRDCSSSKKFRAPSTLGAGAPKFALLQTPTGSVLDIQVSGTIPRRPDLLSLGLGPGICILKAPSWA